MSNPKQSIGDRLVALWRAIGSPLANPELLAALAIFGFDNGWFTTSKTLYQEAEKLNNEQERKLGLQTQATADFEALRQEVQTLYTDALKVARTAFKSNQHAITSLRLKGTRARGYGPWLEQITTFYANLLAQPDLLAVISRFSYTQAKLEGEMGRVKAMVAAKTQQDIARGESQEATQRRDAQLDELEERVAELWNVAPVALREHPQWLEEIGKVVSG